MSDMTAKVEQWMRDAAKAIWDAHLPWNIGVSEVEEKTAEIIASHAPQEEEALT